MTGNTRAEFSEFAHSRWSGLVRLGYGLTGDRGLAEDLAQTALASAYASWRRVRRADDPDAYVRRILINNFRSAFRKRQVTEELGVSAPGFIADPSDAHADHAAVIAAVATLPPKQREVVLLRFWLDLTEVQAAATLGCSVGNVKSQTARALAKLRVRPELADWGAS